MIPAQHFTPLRFQIVGSDLNATFHVGKHAGPHDKSLWHYHPEFELITFARDGGVLFLGTEIHTFESGELFLIGGDLPHCWSSSSATGPEAQTIFVQFLPDCLGRDFFQLPQMRDVARLLDQSRRGIRFSARLATMINPRLDALHQLPPGDWRRVHEMLGILGTLAEGGDYEILSVRPPVDGMVANRRVQAILHFIDAHVEDDLTRNAVSAHIGLPPTAFSRYFRRQFGRTFIQYVKELRLKRACHLLLNSDASITEVAFRSGFNNLSNFNRQFLALMKISPKKYRQTMPRSGRESATVVLRTAGVVAARDRVA